MADWKCLSPEEERMVRSLGFSPEPMVVNRLGEGHWQFLNMKTREELLVTERADGTLRSTVEVPEITAPAGRNMRTAEHAARDGR